MIEEREEIPFEEIPEQWQYLHEYVPYLKYQLKDDYRRAGNKTGHVQRAHSVYWSIVIHKKTRGLGLDIGCGNVISPFCIGVDYYADTKGGGHPIYGGHGYKPHVCAMGEYLPFKDDAFDWIISNHSLEHMENTYETLTEWLRILKPGGIMAIIMPDRKYGPFGDPSHKHEYTPDDFFSEILIPLLDDGRIRLLEYDTFNNHFSFNCVLEKT